MNRKPLILCADDNVNILEAWNELLHRNGYEVITATDGNEAVKAFRSHAVDLVLVDYHMPQMNDALRQSNSEIFASHRGAEAVGCLYPNNS